ncbi:hypothetical protein [Polaromonas sp.]|uniref:hypothetical protein n=1 Tax=Polaromonas sp. TaxID=1869339 RepID=UPI0037522E0D
MHELATPLAVVCHDAGATNLILAWLKAWKGGAVRAYMQGPAAVLWRRTFPDIPLCESLDSALDGAASLVSGTGWATELEHVARVRAKSQGIHTVAVLDHWVNYPQRFERGGQVQWPDELWVADEYALRLADAVLPGIPVRQFENLYLKAQVECVRPAPGKGTLLYVLEPVRQTWGKDVEGEFQALDFALAHLDSLSPSGVHQILLRPHPSEDPEKYQDYLARDARVRMDCSVDISDALSCADLVVGVESFALILALAVGRPVYSSLPPWAPALRLPHAGIQQIRHRIAS